ncbi:MAG: type IV pilin-like G/H family protein [Tychonema bourrellyi B0820]|uniref:Pesticin n=1 Tax=Tychonema bourrellyi FEM_GT703 TaxID=2040638 RepID=A0A2G4F494_9CYAN|nr:type IV pilin-like G/H family protein [Tychonema bourrellyi]MDQ2096113.1 type IV pilin-like G/H family protein [Tychonema bourrellyi B0820]PHX56566.1 pesticin [Tychonema bourrellyi FEM_GT703]
MKTEFKAKFLQQINKRRQDQGFTLIELLVVIIIIGILSAIALPAFLNQANKAKQSEGKQYVASINKGQQAFYAENSKFSVDTTGTELGLGIKTATSNYEYDLSGGNTGTGGVVNVKPLVASLKGYGGSVALVTAGEAKTTTTIICQEGTTNTGNKGDLAAGATACSGTVPDPVTK